MGPISEDDRGLVIRCLGEALEGDYFPDWEFETLMGFSRNELRGFLDAAKSSPALEPLPEMRQVVGSVLNNLTGCPHGLGTRVEKRVGSTLAELDALYERVFGGAQ